MSVVNLEDDKQVEIAMILQGAAVGDYTEEIPCPGCGGSGISPRFGDDWCGACGGCGVSWRMRRGITLSLLVEKR